MIKAIKLILTIIAVMSTADSYSQSSYCPPKPAGISEAEYRRGRLMLKNNFEEFKNSKQKICYAVYWNMAVAYSTMGQPVDTIYNFLKMSKATGESEFCALAKYEINSEEGGIENTGFYKELGDRYKDLVESCSSTQSKPEKQFDVVTYSKEGKYNLELVKELDRIIKLDQKHRAYNYDHVLQTPLDQQNMRDIEKIISKYGYPGKSLVGEQYDYIACSIIQRCNSMESWDKYLPLVSAAVKSGELSDINHLKMLIDRVYIDKVGAQIFGSKAGVQFADDETIASVRQKYAIGVKYPQK